MADSFESNVVVATRFSHLAGDPRPLAGSKADLQYEALTALAESLDLLALTLNSFPNPPTLDANRLARLRKRTMQLQRVCDPYAQSESSHTKSSSAQNSIAATDRTNLQLT